MGITLHPKSRVAKNWHSRLYNYDLTAKETVRALRALRTNPNRYDPLLVAVELGSIFKQNPPNIWTHEERRALADLFGNNHPSQGIVFREAIELYANNNQQERMDVAHILMDASLLEGRRAHRARTHGRLLVATTNLRVQRLANERLN